LTPWTAHRPKRNSINYSSVNCSSLNYTSKERLRRARDLLAVKGFDTRRARVHCYSGAGFSPELRSAQHTDADIHLVDLEQLYAD
jgi:hypothetical protein